MKFKKDVLQDGIGGDGPTKTIESDIVDHSRWSVGHRRVFEFEGKFYLTFYSRGATESQDESPYEYDDEEIECQEVFPVQKTITVYE